MALVAVRRYRLVHNQVPATLQAAIRETKLSRILTDVYSGQPLRYKVIDGKSIVYSVGSDQRDDGGELDWKYGRQPGDFLFLDR